MARVVRALRQKFMSLVRLLTAGKSLVGIQDSRSRYRSVDPRALPKFGSEKKINTEIAGEGGVKPRGGKSSPGPAKADVRVAADANVRAPFADKKVVARAGDKNVGVTKPAEKARTKAARQDRSSGWVSELGSKLSSLVSQKPKAARRAVPRFNGVPVQGELSLDNIKVVRNDLSDADLEVVAKKAAPAEEVEVRRGASRAAEFVKLVARSVRSAPRAGRDARPTVDTARGDARPSMTPMFSAVKS